MSDFDAGRYKQMFRDELFWIVSDQSLDYDDVLQMPIARRKSLMAHARTYFDTIGALKDDDPATLIDEAFDRFLDGLRKDGEDVDRLLLWLGSMDDWRGEDGLGVGALDAWRGGLWRWAAHKAPWPKDQALDYLLNTYVVEVHRPLEDLYRRCKASRAVFMSGADARTNWDNYLWEVYFSGIGADPTTLFRHNIDNLLHRQWWRRHNGDVSAESKAHLFDGLANNIQDHGDALMQDWSCVIEIDAAFRIDEVPDFDRYCKARPA